METQIIKGLDGRNYGIYGGQIYQVDTSSTMIPTTALEVKLNKKCKENKCIIGNLGRCIICENK